MQLESNYGDFFRRARNDASAIPFPYQERLATTPWPELIDVPTGLGKTAAVVLAWAYKRAQGDAATPRRLVYCLPMRSLVEQTVREASSYFERLGRPVSVYGMLGGADAEELKAFLERPEDELVLVGTQDMLLSRALNRGYGMSRYQWPIAFGLLHNDAMWVFDETQLMGVGVETSAQLEGLRRALGTSRPSRSLWLSATLGREQLTTVDHPAPSTGFATASLDADDLRLDVVRQRVSSAKTLRCVEITAPTKDAENATYAKKVSDLVVESHVPGARTIVVVNRVARAQAIFEALSKRVDDPEKVVLVHSRFRPADRRAAEARMRAATEGYVVATQAIEAGVDISSARLFTELAPWPSLVQRLGRLNRYGEHRDAQCTLLDIDTSNAKACAPYTPADLETARALTKGLTDVGPSALRAVSFTPPKIVRPVLRRRDLVDLFDTSPELLGNDLDVGRFVRDSNDLDVAIYYRAFAGEPPPDLAAPARDELCAISIGSAVQLFDRIAKASKDDKARVLGAYSWDPLVGRFLRVTRAAPGQTILLSQSVGGYDARLGFTGDGKHVPEVALAVTAAQDSETSGADPDTATGVWVELAAHLAHVEDAARVVVAAVGLPEAHRPSVVRAAAFHDVGKAHAVFQEMLGRTDEGVLWAKSDRMGKRASRVGFRHEWASALALLQTESELDTDLVAYLVAAHHGKVRLSVRALPDEHAPEDDRAFARGVWHGDALPGVALPNGTTVPALSLDATPVRLGVGSWIERTTKLRDDPALGPFVLAFLETLVRVADVRASKAERAAGTTSSTTGAP